VGALGRDALLLHGDVADAKDVRRWPRKSTSDSGS
jgi:hypothetical protein